MVRKVNLKDIDRFYELGELVNDNFKVLFNLDNILSSEYDYILGYYDENNLLVGFIHFSKMYETVDIVNIVVDESKRKCGIGTILLKELINYFDDVTNIMLEVNENNISAINLYKKNSFYIINKRNNYYGSDAALIMKRDV